MRPSEQITIEAKSKDNSDFGRANPTWESLCENIHAEISGSVTDARGSRVTKTGRLTRSGDQMVPVFDEDITILYHEPTHRAWQQKRALRITDTLSDVYGVKSMKVLKDRVWRLKMGVVRN